MFNVVIYHVIGVVLPCPFRILLVHWGTSTTLQIKSAVQTTLSSTVTTTIIAVVVGVGGLIIVTLVLVCSLVWISKRKIL